MIKRHFPHIKIINANIPDTMATIPAAKPIQKRMRKSSSTGLIDFTVSRLSMRYAAEKYVRAFISIILYAETGRL